MSRTNRKKQLRVLVLFLLFLFCFVPSSLFFSDILISLLGFLNLVLLDIIYIFELYRGLFIPHEAFAATMFSKNSSAPWISSLSKLITNFSKSCTSFSSIYYAPLLSLVFLILQYFPNFFQVSWIYKYSCKTWWKQIMFNCYVKLRRSYV